MYRVCDLLRKAGYTGNVEVMEFIYQHEAIRVCDTNVKYSVATAGNAEVLEWTIERFPNSHSTISTLMRCSSRARVTSKSWEHVQLVQ